MRMGALVSIPLSAGVRVLVIRVFAPGVRKWTGAVPYDEQEESEEPTDDDRDAVIENAFRRQNAAAFITRAVTPEVSAEDRLRPEEAG